MSIAAARRLCRQFGIKLVTDNVHCRQLETYCGNTIARLLAKHGEGAMVLTLRVFAETHPENGSHLNREVITAVHAVCRSKRDWIALGLPFLEAWDDPDLSELRREANGMMDLAPTSREGYQALARAILRRCPDIMDSDEWPDSIHLHRPACACCCRHWPPDDPHALEIFHHQPAGLWRVFLPPRLPPDHKV